MTVFILWVLAIGYALAVVGKLWVVVRLVIRDLYRFLSLMFGDIRYLLSLVFRGKATMTAARIEAGAANDPPAIQDRPPTQPLLRVLKGGRQ